MVEAIPHYWLLSEARSGAPRAGEWRFVLESADGEARLEVDADEPDADQERLDLLAVVRGLEALDQPSRVTLVTSSPYVNHGFRFGLEAWRENDWTWERFGEMTPVKNADLWRRVDRALRYHRVACSTWRFDRSHADESDAPEHVVREHAAAAVEPAPSTPAAERDLAATPKDERAARREAPALAPGAASVPAPHFRRSRAPQAAVRPRAALRDDAPHDDASTWWTRAREWLADTLTLDD